MPKALFARVQPFDPKRGRTTQNVHAEGTLFRGGSQPVWYKVSEDLANKLAKHEQPTGAPMFQIVDEDEKAELDRKEQARRLVAMGMISDTVHDTAGPRKQEIDLTGGPAEPTGPRAAAVPTPEEVPAPAPTPEAEPAASGGDLTTGDLPTAPVAAPPPPVSED
jgi:hypothetical protein